MLKKIGLGILMLLVLPAQAAYNCQVKLQDDIIVTPQSVRVIGASGDLSITPKGLVTKGGKVLTLSKEIQEKARIYQQGLRRELPLINSQAKHQLQRAKSALDKIIVQKLGHDSKLRNHLNTLESDLRQEMARVLEQKDDQHIIFHHQAVQQVEKEGKNRVQRAMGAILQDSLNEISQRAVNNKTDNSLQAMLGGLGDLQQSIRSQWQQQEQEFQLLGQNICQKLLILEKQRTMLLQAL